MHWVASEAIESYKYVLEMNLTWKGKGGIRKSASKRIVDLKKRTTDQSVVCGFCDAEFHSYCSVQHVLISLRKEMKKGKLINRKSHLRLVEKLVVAKGHLRKYLQWLLTKLFKLLLLRQSPTLQSRSFINMDRDGHANPID